MPRQIPLAETTRTREADMVAIAGAHDGGQHEVSSTTPLSPELVSLLDTLDARSLSASADASYVASYAADRARSLCRLVQDGQKLIFQPGDGVGVLRHVYRLLFSNSPSARKGARLFMEAVREPLPRDFDMMEVSGQLVGDGDYHKWMLAEIMAGNVDGLKAWQVTIYLLGKIVHQSSGTSLLNSLLAIAEKGFKSDDTQLRKETFQAWQVLVDNFASNENILLHPKRIRLITRPLVANNNMNKEPLARAKFNAWWHFICKLGPNVVNNVDNVVIPFLEFCYGRSQSENMPLKTSHAPSSPVKKFGAMSSECLDAFAQILSCQIPKTVVTPLNLKGKVLEVKNIVVHRHAILHAVTEAFTSVNVTNNADLEKFGDVFVAVANMIHSIESSDKVDDVKTVILFLCSVHTVIVDSKKYPEVHPIILTMLEEIRKLPSSVLLSRVEETTLLGQPLSSMLKLVLDRDLLPNFYSTDYSSKLRKQIHAIFQGFMKKGCATKVSALPLLEEVSSTLGNCLQYLPNDCKRNFASNMWKLLASYLKEHIDRHQEINQTESTLEHNFSACNSILIFPFDYLSDEPQRNLWKQWIDLYIQIATAAALVTSYKPLELESKLCKVITQKLQLSSTRQQLENFSNILKYGIIKEIPYKTIDDKEKSKERMGWIMEAIVALIERLPTIKESSNCTTVAKCICDASSFLLTQSSSQGLHRLFMKSLVPSLVPLLRSDFLDSLGRAYIESAETLFNNVLTLIQSRYKGSFDKVLLQDILPFLTATMNHQKRHLRQKAQQMWQVTFAPTLALADIPPEISIILRKSLVLSSDSSQSTVSTDEEGSIPGLGFSSFFKDGMTPSKKVDVKQTPSPFKSFKRPERTCKKATLEDESSSDFVPITNSGKKRRPLTDHQKERLTSRSDDIPALYSELSRDDSQPTNIPAQFSSQLSQDDSSQAALDESTFKKLSDKRMISGLPELSESPIRDNTSTVDLTVSQGTDTESIESLEGSSSKRRKGRQPVKNLAPLAKRKTELGSMVTPERKRRGRPPKTKPPAEDETVMVRDETGLSTSATGMLEKSQEVLLTPAAVKIARLSPTQNSMVTRSPVKVIQENPLVIVCAQDKVNDCSGNQETGVLQNNIPEVARDLSFEADSEMIQSSQSSDETNVVRGKKRKRDSSTATLSDKSTNPKNAESDATSLKVQKAKRSLPLRRPADKENLILSQQRPFRNSKNQYGETHLHMAVKKGDLEKAKSLLENGADVHARDHAGWTPIHESIRNNPYTLEIIKALLEHGADINVQADNGNTPLHDAVVSLSDKVLQFLLENGANAELRNKDGMAPIDLAPIRLKPFLNRQTSAKRASGSMITPSLTRLNERDNCDNQSNVEVVDLTAPMNGIALLSSVSNVKESTNELEKEDTAAYKDDCQSTTTPSEISEVAENRDMSGSSLSSSSQLTMSTSTFTRLHEKQQQRRASLQLSGRGAKILEMAKAKCHVGQFLDKEEIATPPVMSPKVTANPLPISSDNLTTPTSHRKLRPWEKFQPSPSDASPSTSILKKSLSESDTRDSPSVPPPVKRRRVQFKEPPVSERVEIPRCPTSNGEKSARQRLAAPRFNKEIPLLKPFSNEGSQQDSVGLYESTPPIDVSDNSPIFPSLVECDEPVTSILAQLANITWQKAAEKSLTDNGITKISQLSRLTPLEARVLKGLKPPNPIATIQDALKKFEKKRENRLNSQLIDQQCRETEEIFKKIAPVVDISTPEEDEQTMQELYERPSPSPTEQLGTDVPSDVTSKSMACDIGPPPPLICLNPEKAMKLLGDGASDPMLNIPTIVFASPSKRGTNPREQWTVSKNECSPSHLHKECQASLNDEGPIVQHKECQVSLNEEGPILLHKECQAKVASMDAESLTDVKDTKDMEIQAVTVFFEKESQTRPNEKEEDLAEVMRKVEVFDSKMLGEVMEKCLMLMRSKM